MSVQVETMEKSMAKLTITVPADRFEEAMQRAYMKQKGKISIQGFRKGKVPRAMVEKMYGPAVFYEDAANDLIPDAFDEAAKESGLSIVSRPEIDVTQIEKGKDFIFTAEVAVKPEVKLGEYKGIEVEKSDTTVSDEELDAELNRVLEQNSRTIDVEGRPVEDKDIAVIDFEGYVEGEAFEGGSGKDFNLTIGSHSFIDDFEEQLIGASIGEEKEVNVTFPENYHSADLAGKPALFKVKINAIKRKDLPQLDDDLVQDISEFDSVAEYKEDVRKRLTEGKENQAKREKEDAVIDKIIENAQMELPEPMIDTQVSQMANEFARNIQRQGLSIDMYLNYTGLTKEKFVEQMRPQAVKRIQTRLVMEEVVKAENIQISDEEYEEELEKMAKSYQMELDKMKEMTDDETKKDIILDLSVQKAITLVADNAVEK